jgi:hypothetical protein
MSIRPLAACGRPGSKGLRFSCPGQLCDGTGPQKCGAELDIRPLVRSLESTGATMILELSVIRAAGMNPREILTEVVAFPKGMPCSPGSMKKQNVHP